MDNQLTEKCINTVRVLSADIVEKAKSGHPGAPMVINTNSDSVLCYISYIMSLMVGMCFVYYRDVHPLPILCFLKT